MIERIVTGGQTGVDQAALSMATEAGVEVGGWCPKGGLDENAKDIRTIFPTLKEASTSNPDERTRLNIDHSDGTLIIVPCIPLPPTIVDGTRLTMSYAAEQGKPFLIIGLSDNHEAADRILEWVSREHISTLNIGGPRESSSPGIYHETCGLLRDIFYSLKPRAEFGK